MWQSQIETIQSNRILKYRLYSDRYFTYLEVIKLWQSDGNFNVFFNSLLARCPFAAYFWETPPIKLSTVNKEFEFVLVNNHQLQEVNPNSQPFQKYFASASAEREIVVFPNLGNDAKLVVPCPHKEHSTYTHIANFARQAPQSQQQALWQTVGEVMGQNLNEQPIWLNTSGLGVHWLHVRLDSYPKYYNYQPYK